MNGLERKGLTPFVFLAIPGIISRKLSLKIMLNKKIFIIEDDANILYALQAKFSIEGFQVEIDNGTGEREEVLNKIRIFRPDFIVMDLVLPRMDGKELLHAIKADEYVSGAYVFVFSDFSDEDDRARRERTGADYFLVKEKFLVDEFVAKVKKIIENKAKIN